MSPLPSLFPLNDLFHIETLGRQVSRIERLLNDKMGRRVLVHESYACRRFYGGEKFGNNESITNIIFDGDAYLLIPALILVGLASTVVAVRFLTEAIGLGVAILYLVGIAYMLIVVGVLGFKLWVYRRPNGALDRLVASIDEGPPPSTNTPV